MMISFQPQLCIYFDHHFASMTKTNKIHTLSFIFSEEKKRRRSTTLPLNKHITNANANMNMDSILSFVLLHSTFCKILLLIFNVTFNLDNHENTVAMNKCIIKQKISYQENFKIAIDILKRW